MLSQACEQLCSELIQSVDLTENQFYNADSNTGKWWIKQQCRNISRVWQSVSMFE